MWLAVKQPTIPPTAVVVIVVDKKKDHTHHKTNETKPEQHHNDHDRGEIAHHRQPHDRRHHYHRAPHLGIRILGDGQDHHTTELNYCFFFGRYCVGCMVRFVYLWWRYKCLHRPRGWCEDDFQITKQWCIYVCCITAVLICIGFILY